MWWVMCVGTSLRQEPPRAGTRQGSCGCERMCLPPFWRNRVPSRLSLGLLPRGDFCVGAGQHEGKDQRS
jgi:hypothetical protein